MNRIVYADNAATTRLSDKAFKEMIPFLRDKYGNPSSVYSLGKEARAALRAAAADVAECLNADESEIYFTSGGSESDNWALIGAAELCGGRGHLIVSAVEHHAILRTAEYLKARGFDVTFVGCDVLGRVAPEKIKAEIRDDTFLVSVMTANNEVGTIQSVNEIGKIASENKILFHTDAVQAAGHIGLDVQRMHADMLSLSAHKFNGPRGCGALFVRKGIELPSFIRGGAQQNAKRAGTENVAGVVGMAAALKEAVGEISSEGFRLRMLRDRLVANVLSDIKGVYLTGDAKNRLPGTASFVFEGIEGASLVMLLDMMGICVSGGSACSSSSQEPSHVLTAMGFDSKLAAGALRVTLGKYNTEDDVDILSAKIPEAVAELRKF